MSERLPRTARSPWSPSSTSSSSSSSPTPRLSHPLTSIPSFSSSPCPCPSPEPKLDWRKNARMKIHMAEPSRDLQKIFCQKIGLFLPLEDCRWCCPWCQLSCCASSGTEFNSDFNTSLHSIRHSEILKFWPSDASCTGFGWRGRQGRSCKGIEQPERNAINKLTWKTKRT